MIIRLTESNAELVKKIQESLEGDAPAPSANRIVNFLVAEGADKFRAAPGPRLD